MTVPTTALTAPDILRRAARALETGEIRWGRGDFIDQAGCRCALGAITYAVAPTDRYGSPRTIANDEARIHATLAAHALAEWITDRLDATPACTDGQLDVIETVGEWNDRDTRSVDDVIEALTDAATELDRLVTR